MARDVSGHQDVQYGAMEHSLAVENPISRGCHTGGGPQASAVGIVLSARVSNKRTTVSVSARWYSAGGEDRKHRLSRTTYAMVRRAAQDMEAIGRVEWGEGGEGW